MDTLTLYHRSSDTQMSNNHNVLPIITPQTTLGDLPLHDFQVSPQTTGQVIAQQFEQRSNLPGVIVADDLKMLGVISRRRFHERMSMPYAQEIFLKRPIQILLNMEVSKYQTQVLELSDSEEINSAVQAALSRPHEDAYEPIIVVFQDQSLPEFRVHFLLDLQTLLLAQSQMLTAVNQKMQRQQAELEQQQKRVEEERRKVSEYTQLLEKHQSVIQERNLLLETQQIELLEQAREIAQFNKRFMRIGRLLSSEGRKAFQATFSGVNAICHNTNQVVEVGQLLSGELHTVHDTSQLISKVSQQVRHLSVQAAIVANQIGREMAGFSHITAEIGKLVSQTLEAGRQIDRVASRFQVRIQELTESADAGTTVAQSLLGKIQQAQEALAELERLVQPRQDLLSQRIPLGLSHLQAQNGEGDEATNLLLPSEEQVTEAAQALVQKISMAEATVADLEDLLHRRDTEPLIKKIRRTLEQNRARLNYSSKTIPLPEISQDVQVAAIEGSSQDFAEESDLDQAEPPTRPIRPISQSDPDVNSVT